MPIRSLFLCTTRPWIVGAAGSGRASVVVSIASVAPHK